MYYKTIKSNIPFKEAIDCFKNGNTIQYKDRPNVINPNEVKLSDIKFSIEQIESSDWNVVEIDYEMNNKIDEVADMMEEMGLYIDSRFHTKSKMDIGDYWILFNEQNKIDDKLAFEIIKWIYDNKKYKK